MKRKNISTTAANGDTMTIEQKNNGKMGFTISIERSGKRKETPQERKDRMASENGQGSGYHTDKRDQSRSNVKQRLNRGEGW